MTEVRANSDLQRRCPALAGIFAALWLTSPRASADELGLPAGYRPVHPVEIALGIGGLVAAGLSSFVLPEPSRRWDGRNDFDESLRDALRSPNQGTRDDMAALSDGFFYGVVAYPVVVDAGLVTWLGHGNGETAGELALMDLAALGESGLIATLGEYSGRARPYVHSCDRPGEDLECDVPGRHRGFLSGHTFAAFTGAGLVCVQHRFLPLYGSTAADLLACAGGLALASANAVLRVTSDMHYSSDVLLAATGGLAFGYLLPSLLHFGSRGDAMRVTPSVDSEGARLVLWGLL